MKGFIYVIRSKQTTDVYYGSTKKSLDIRFEYHKYGYVGYLKGNQDYVTSYEIIQYDDAFIELVETVEYEDKEELKKREGYYIQNYECINKQIAGRSRSDNSSEYHITHRDSILERQKKYREDNKELIKKKAKEQREKNKIKELERQKEYREKNRDKIRENDRLRYLKKKESLL